MVTWYSTVCDTHKEYCHIICNTNYYTTFVYQEKDADLICAFFNKHYGCKLRLIHNDMDLDYLHENNYIDIGGGIPRLSEEERKEYVLENNAMLDEETYINMK